MVAIHRGAIGRGGIARLGIRPSIARGEVLARLLDVADRTKLAAGLPAGVPLAHKTGFTEAVKHDAGIIYLRRGPVVAVAMSWSAGGVSDAVGDGFIARVAASAARLLGRGGRCAGLPLAGSLRRRSDRAGPRD
jgi:beta-lactamase class A